MSDPDAPTSSATPSATPAADPGNANRDRGDLQDLPPAQVDDESVHRHADVEGEAGTDADAARG